MVLGKGAILLFLFSFKNKSNSHFVSDAEKKVDSELLNLDTHCLVWHKICRQNIHYVKGIEEMV